VSLLDTLIDIVNIPSVTGDEDELCTWIEDRFASAGRKVTRIGESVVVGEPIDGAPFYALYGHLDTVPVQGEWTARVDGDRLVGLGVSDMKSGVAVMVDLLEDPDLRDSNFVGVFYDKEEGPGAENGLEAVLEGCSWLADAALSIVMEPTDLNVEFGCNGVLNAEVVFEGSSAHSARPWLGENAVTKAGSWLASLHDREREVFDVSGLNFTEVFSVTQAHGGFANNIIPPIFIINLNYRFPPVFSIEEAEARLREVAADADRIVINDSAPAGRVDLDDPQVRRFESIVGRERVAKQGWTDVARLTSRGVPAVNYGPGEVAQAHQVGESMQIENLAVAYDVMKTFLAGDAPPVR
jgi:succinyl-diaminopimelate desuccinylase